MFKPKSVLLLAVCGTTLLPLYGDPRQAPVTHAEWARLMLNAMDLSDALPPQARASTLFASLSWKEALLFPAAQYERTEGTNLTLRGPRQMLAATSELASVHYPLTIIQPGDYRLRLKLQGSQDSPSVVDLVRRDDEAVVVSFPALPTPEGGWREAGRTHLDPGLYYARVQLRGDALLERLELTPPCLVPVEPLGGWKGTALLYADDVAVTLLRATELEHELPPGDWSEEVPASRFVSATPDTQLAADGGGGEAYLTADQRGLTAHVMLDVPEPGVYTLYSFGLQGAGQSWTADGCAKSVICPYAGADIPRPQWRTVLTREFTAGRHGVSVTLAEGAAVSRLRLERKRHDAEAYLATLDRLGFDAGAPGPISRERAIDALSFLRKRASERAGAFCGDVGPQAGEQFASAQGTQIGDGGGLGGAPPSGPGGGGGTPPGGGGPPGGRGGPPGGGPPPVLPPQDVASPTNPIG